MHTQEAEFLQITKGDNLIQPVSLYTQTHTHVSVHTYMYV